MNRLTRKFRANPLTSFVHALTWILLALGVLSHGISTFLDAIWLFENRARNLCCTNSLATSQSELWKQYECD